MSTFPSSAGLGPLELQVMTVLWARSPQDVTSVQAALKGESAYSTVKTLLERLTAKGFLAREKVGKAFEYRPIMTRAALEEQVARTLSRNLLLGFGSSALTHFVDTVREDPTQLNELRRLLAELEVE